VGQTRGLCSGLVFSGRRSPTLADARSLALHERTSAGAEFASCIYRGAGESILNVLTAYEKGTFRNPKVVRRRRSGSSSSSSSSSVERCLGAAVEYALLLLLAANSQAQGIILEKSSGEKVDVSVNALDFCAQLQVEGLYPQNGILRDFTNIAKPFGNLGRIIVCLNGPPTVGPGSMETATVGTSGGVIFANPELAGAEKERIDREREDSRRYFCQQGARCVELGAVADLFCMNRGVGGFSFQDIVPLVQATQGIACILYSGFGEQFENTLRQMLVTTHLVRDCCMEIFTSEEVEVVQVI
jgi:hypothetical protein